MNLLEQISNELTEAEKTSAVIMESFKMVAERTNLLEGTSVAVLTESAISTLAKLVQQAEAGQFDDIDQATDVLTVLELMADPEHREAFGNILTNRVFTVLVRELGENEAINRYVSKLARFASVLPARRRMKALLTLVSDPEESTKVVSMIRKLRMAYERIQIDSFKKRNPSLESGNVFDV